MPLELRSGADADARTLSSLLSEKLGAKGGGSREMVQGTIFAAKEQICAVMKEAVERKAEKSL